MAYLVSAIRGPLTPARSPSAGERGKAQALRPLLPLPRRGGEGRGEGELVVLARRSRRKRLARVKLAGGVNEGAGRMIDNHQFGLVEVKHFAKFLGNSDFIGAIVRGERPVVSQGEKLLRVRPDVASMGQRKT